MMRITLDSPALIAVRSWLADLGARQTQRSGRNGRRTASRLSFRGEQLEPRLMLDAGMRAVLPDLLEESDTGASFVDNFTSDRTPTLSGSVLGPASQVRLMIDGQSAGVIPVADGTWNYTVPAEAALATGNHRIAVLPLDASGKAGKLSKPLSVTIETKAPTAPTVGLGALSDTGSKGDGKTTFATPMLRGFAPRGQWVNVEIDSVLAGRVKSNAKTGEWLLQAPQLASGVHDVTAVAESRSGIRSAATSFEIEVSGQQTVMLDASDRNTVELTPSHLFGQGSQGFIVTAVQRGTLQQWSPAKNKWVTIPSRPDSSAALLNAPPANRTILFNQAVRWTPSQRDVGIGPAFDVISLDRKGGLTASLPEAGTVPGKILDAKINFTAGVGTTLTWAAPTDGCGCASTRYSIEVTREDGKTLLYSVPASVTQLSVPEGGRVLQAELWGATKSGAGTKRSYDAVEAQLNKNRLAFNVVSGLSALSVGEKARAQLAFSPTAVDGSKPTVALGGSHTNLAYLELSALPDATEAAQGLLAGTPILISSDSNKLTPAQKATLENNPILARNLFPGTVNGQVQPDQVRAHFQAGETLRFAGNVDKSVRAGARIVVEEAQILVDNTLGPWFEKASLAVAADGAYSYDHVVAYGMTSVRVRLEYPTTPAALGASAPASSTPKTVSTAIDLSLYFNAFGITTAPWQVPNNQGFDGNGNYYNSDYTQPVPPENPPASPIPGTPIIYQGITFPIGNIPTEDSQVGLSGNSATQNPPNFVQSKGQTITVDVAAGASDFLYLAGAAANGNQLSQPITLKFADGSPDEIWTQSFHDWSSGGPPQPSKLADGFDSATVLGDNQKLPVRVATTASLQNSNPALATETFSGLQTIDGVALAEGDRVLVKDQAHQQYNGIYVAFAGTWVRAKDALTPEQLVNASVSVLSGTINGGNYFWNNELSSELLPALQSHLPELLATFKSYLSELLAADPKLSRKILKIELELDQALMESPKQVPELIRTTIIHQLYSDMWHNGYNVQQLKAMEAKINNLIAEIYPVNFVAATAPVPTPRTFAGELLLKTEPERINQQGNLVTTPAHLFAYCYNLHGKQLASITLPDNENVGILSVVVAKAPVIAIDQGIASLVLGTTNLTGVDVMALTIVNESNIGAGGGPLTFYFADQPEKGSTASVALSSIATTGGISRDGQSFSGDGFDGGGNAYSWEALGSSKILRGTSVNFKLGLPEQKNFVVANGQTIQVPQGSSYTTLNLAGAAINGGQENQPLTLTFTDNSTAVWTQSFSDWTNPANYTNESTIATAVYRDTASGGRNQTTNHIYQYSYTIPSGKTLKSITLPTNSNVRLLDIQITPPTYTTKQVTVPMGQQTTIAYIAPDSTSGMAFQVQQADGTCLGNCSTFLTDWTSGSGSSKNTAENISPSLNSQMKAGQHWTMTVQNAGEGYYGYLDSPSGKNLPGPSGNTPGGAQFRLMTQAEIKAQPPWLLATETIIGTAIVIVGIGIATGGTADVGILIGEGTSEIITDESSSTIALEVASQDGANAFEIENIPTDVIKVREDYFETDAIEWEYVDQDHYIPEIEVIEDDFGNQEIWEDGELVRIEKPFNAYSIFGKISKAPPVA